VSAVAAVQAEAVSTPTLHAVEPVANPNAVADAEMYRWMLWFGLPIVGVAFVIGAMFATGRAWLIGPAIALIVADIFVLVWLSMSSDTNGTIGEAPSH
jgi:hypothetical protein